MGTFFRWILLDKQIQKEKELIRLANAKGGGGYFGVCSCGEYLLDFNLT